MKTTTETEKKWVPDVTIDPKLNKYKDVVLFPEKLALAKEHLKNLVCQNFQRRSTAANKSIAASVADTAQHQH